MPADAKRDERKSVRRYWDAHPISTDSVPFSPGSAESFDAIFERWQRGINPRRLGFLERCAGKRLLEVGCGIAIDGRYLAGHGANYQAVDLSRESLKLACEHFKQNDLPPRFSNADATRLPFQDETFDVVYSAGVLHHVPDMKAACREVVRVVRPGGRVRIMLYHRHSYHCLLVKYLVSPLIWLLLKLPFGASLARRAPDKLRQTYEICRESGFDLQRILSISTDTSTPGEGNFNPLSYFVSADDVRELFEGLEDFEFYCTDLKYFPFPFFRQAVAERWGFFLQMTARKRGAESPS